MNTHYENLSHAQLILKLHPGLPYCESWLTVPAENVWSTWIRITLYTFVLLYLFVGIAVSSDVFMFSIERITAKKRKVSIFDEEQGKTVEVEVFVWNETVANLTLMALGSSAPEILLAVIEAVKTISNPPDEIPDSLGLFTILGSAAFNLFGIAGICIISIPSPTVKRIEKFGVFVLTSICSLFAYAWMLLATVYISPQVIELWEAIVTFLFFPLMVLLAYAQDSGWWRRKTDCLSNKEEAKCQIDSLELHSPHHRKMTAEVNAGREGLDQTNRSVPSADSEAATEEKPRRSNDIPYGRRSTTQQSPFRRFMFRHMAMNRFSRLNQYVRRVSTDYGSLSNGIQNLGKAFFLSQTYAVVLGASEISIPVQFQRHPGVEESIFETNEEEECGGKESNGTTVGLNHELDRTVPGKGGDVSLAQPSARSPLPPPTAAAVAPPPPTTATATQRLGRRMSKANNETNPSALSNGTFVVGYELRPGLAKPGIHYENIVGGVLHFCGEETEQQITVQLNPELPAQPMAEPLDFLVILHGNAIPEVTNPSENVHVADGQKTHIANPGTPSVVRVQILSPDAADYFEMQASHFYADGNAGAIHVTILRQGTCHMRNQVELITRDGTAKQNQSDKGSWDYEAIDEILTFEPGEASKTISVAINPKKQCFKYFIIKLNNPSPGSNLGSHREAICYLHPTDYTEASEDIADGDVGWAQQFRMAVSLIPSVNEDGIQMPLTNADYAMHGITFFWKLICAFLPPRKYLGAYPTFFSSLAFIGLLTALVEEFSNLLGCVAGLRTAVTGISLVALGTSLPDAFASRTAARFDDSADNSIGNITGSNSVNVFLGLGLPWLISAVHASLRGTQYCVATTGVFEGTMLFLPSAIMVLGILVFRRRRYDGELGGPVTSKWFTGLVIIATWVVYVTVLSLKSYDVIHWETSVPQTSCVAKV